MSIFSDWLDVYFDEVTPYEFYRDIFAPGELDTKDSYTKGKYTGIAVEVTREKKKNGKPKIKRYCITDDLETINELCKSDNFCLCSPISYCGKQRTADNSRYLYAIAIDLDRIQTRDNRPTGLESLWNGHIINAERVPKPTYIVSSGTGVHLYYVLDKAIPLFNDTAKQLQALKNELTRKIWHGTVVDITHEKEIQQEGIYQGFRIPGTITKKGDRARAFLTGDKVDLEYLNSFVSDKNKVTRYTTKKEITLQKAKELYPEWYTRRIENKEEPRVWHISRNLYDWWLNEILEKAIVGHRYYCLMILSIYAYKCSMYDAKHNPNPVTREELERDCWKVAEHFETLTNEDTNHFTDADVLDALESFDNKWIRYPRNSIEYKCGFSLPNNNRKYRKQTEHLKISRFICDMEHPNGSWRDNNGRKSKQLQVATWRAVNPQGTKADCIRDTGLSKPTVYKWWK